MTVFLIKFWDIMIVGAEQWKWAFSCLLLLSVTCWYFYPIWVEDWTPIYLRKHSPPFPLPPYEIHKWVFWQITKTLLMLSILYIHVIYQIMGGALAQSSSIIFWVDQFPNLFMITEFLVWSQGAGKKESRKARAILILVNYVMKWEWPYKFFGTKDLTFLLCKFKNLI